MDLTRSQMRISLAGILFQLGARTLQRNFEACLGERFEQVIQRAEFKGPNGVLIVRGRENDDWKWARRKSFEHLEPVEPRHLHIQKKQVRLAFLRLLQSLRAVGA